MSGKSRVLVRFLERARETIRGVVVAARPRAVASQREALIAGGNMLKDHWELAWATILVVVPAVSSGAMGWQTKGLTASGGLLSALRAQCA